MAKQLNSDFFGIQNEAKSKPTAQIEVPFIDWLPVRETSALSHLTTENVSRENPTSERSQNIKNQEAKNSELDEIKSQLHEYQSSTKVRLDRVQLAMQKWEQHHSDLSHEVSSKMAVLIQKVNDQKKFDQKVQDIIDRHNNLLKGYEVRMNQLQKLLQQKESDFVEAMSALKEARSEITRLKRL